MRLSNDFDLTFGTDHLGPALIVEGDIKNGIITNAPSWLLQKNVSNDSMRCWRLPKDYTLTRLSNQCPISYLEVIKTALSKRDKKLLAHPALEEGFEYEAQRLFPEISKPSYEAYLTFIHFLRSNYSIDEIVEKDKPMDHFVDDIGPNILVLINNKPHILPEIPKVYAAPKNWVLMMWRINNYMTGPLINMGLKENEIIQFQNMVIPENEFDSYHRGLFYFHMARFILFFEAWTANEKTPHLMEFVRLILEGFDPIKNYVK